MFCEKEREGRLWHSSTDSDNSIIIEVLVKISKEKQVSYVPFTCNVISWCSETMCFSISDILNGGSIYRHVLGGCFTTTIRGVICEQKKNNRQFVHKFIRYLHRASDGTGI